MQTNGHSTADVPPAQPPATTTSGAEFAERATATYAPLALDRQMARVMQHVCGVVALGCGFDAATMSALSVLAELALRYMAELARLTKLSAEHAGRTLPFEGDVRLALRRAGVDEAELCALVQHLARQPPTAGLQVRTVQPPPPSPQLKVGEPQPRPAAIPHFLPPFPQPHTYIETDISCEPDVTYAKHRRACAVHQRRAEVSLITYLLKKHASVSLYGKYEEPEGLKAKARVIFAPFDDPHPYKNALLPNEPDEPPAK
ncbi:Transcription initiation factor TFIID subunit 8 [Aphelenchoides fujianensis]|nr:Transcription initiation factor TFIID subunit 8 [Aphelenchoides fujianensis]